MRANPNLRYVEIMVGLGRLERPTSPLSGVRSNHLSYRPVTAIKTASGLDFVITLKASGKDATATPDTCCCPEKKEKRRRRRPACRGLTGPFVQKRSNKTGQNRS